MPRCWVKAYSNTQIHGFRVHVSIIILYNVAVEFSTLIKKRNTEIKIRLCIHVMINIY